MFNLISGHGRKRHPKHLFSDVENLIDRVFNDDMFFIPVLGQSFRVDVKEDDEKYTVEAELPGMEKENINITFNNGVLTISAKKDEILDEERENFIRKERRYGNIERRLYFDDVDENKVKASYKNGLLSIHLPKKHPGKQRGKIIEIDD